MSPVVDRAARDAEQTRLRLSQQDSAAWSEYAGACRAGATQLMRRRLFKRAMATMEDLALFERDRKDATA